MVLRGPPKIGVGAAIDAALALTKWEAAGLARCVLMRGHRASGGSRVGGGGMFALSPDESGRVKGRGSPA